MSDIQIPNLPPATDLTGAEQLEVVQAGVSRRATIAQIVTDANVPTASNTLPGMDGGASAGVEVTYSRGDHIHPTDTTRYAASNPANYVTATQVTAALGPYALIDSQAFTGTPSMPTGATGVTQTAADSSTKLATTAFVKAQGYAPTSSLGTMSVQNANAVAITGGAINGTTVGATVASTGAFTTLSAVTSANFTTAGTVTINPTTLGHVDNTAVGATTPSTGAFTNLSASGTVSGAGFTTLLTPYALVNSQVFTGTPSLPTGTIGVTQATADSSTKLATTAFVKAQGYQTVAALGTMSTQNANAVAITGGTINGTSVGATTPSTGAFTNLSASGTVSGAGFTALLAPYATTASLGTMSTQNANAVAITGGAINGTTVGATTASTGAFTTLSASGVVSGAGFTTLLSTYAKIDSQAFTGTPSLPTGTTGITQATADSTTKLATTAYVKSQNYLTANQTITLSGDVTGSGAAAIAATVVQLQGRPLSASLPATGNLMGWNGTTWGPVAAGAAAAGGSPNQIQYNNGGVLGGIATTGTFAGSSVVMSISPTFANSIVINSAAGGPSLTMSKFTGAFNNMLLGRTNTFNRWNLSLGNSTAETGSSNVGSDFSLDRYDDAGNFLDRPMTIYRTDGHAAFTVNATFTAGITAGSSTFTNACTIAPSGATSAILTLNKSSGSTGVIAAVEGQTVGSRRWLTIMGNGTTEGGSNAGSDFLINRYSDTAVFIDTPFQIIRSTGVATFSKAILTAGVTINSPAATDAVLTLNKPASGYQSIIYGQKAGVNRWAMSLGNGTAESSNAGSDFYVNRYNDAGTYLDSPLAINRSTAQANFTGAVVTTSGVVTLAPPAGDSILYLAKSGSTKVNAIYGQTGANSRWIMQMGDGVAESGSNAGSNFAISRCNDAGVYIDTPISVNRATGMVNALAFQVNSGTAFARDSIEIGAPAQNAVSFIDFHSGATNNDFDARILSTGGAAAAGNGNLQIYAADVSFSNQLHVAGNVAAAGALVTTGGIMYIQPSGADAFINVCDSALNGGQYRNLAIRGLDLSGTVEASISTVRILATNTYCTGQVDAVGGFACRAGANGGAGGNKFSFNWASPGQFNCYADTTYVGQMAMVSDYRTKKDIAPLVSTWDRVLALNPISYTRKEFQPTNVKANEEGEMPAPLFTEDDTPRWGFVAHELQEALIDDAATGVKDGEDVQSPNQWTVIAALTKALQEAMARIEALEARP